MPKLAEIQNRLLAAGYQPGAPSRIDREADSAIAEEADCGACGRRGLVYHPFTQPPEPPRTSSRRYVAVAVCRACGEASQF